MSNGTDWMNADTKYRRAKTGNTYHLANCPRAKNTLPWSWAEGRTVEDVQSSHVNGLRPCKACLPNGPTAPTQV